MKGSKTLAGPHGYRINIQANTDGFDVSVFEGAESLPDNRYGGFANNLKEAQKMVDAVRRSIEQDHKKLGKHVKEVRRLK